MIRVWHKHSLHGRVAYGYSYFTDANNMELVAYSRCIYKVGIIKGLSEMVGIMGVTNRVIRYFNWKNGLRNRMMSTDSDGKIDSHLVVIPHMI